MKNTFKNDNSYYLVRRAQLKILMRSYFRNGELFEIMNRKAFEDMAIKLADKYFHKTGPTVYAEMVDLYKVFLCLAPVIQKQQNSCKLDWSRLHILSHLRRLFNNKVKHWYYKVSVQPRMYDPDSFKSVMRASGITDATFIDYSLEKYLCFWGAEGRKGNLANCIFDPFFFHVKTGTGLRIENVLIETVPTKAAGFTLISEVPLEIMCYRISTYELYGRHYVDIRLSDNYIKSVREKLITIVTQKITPEQKFKQIVALANNYIENARYAKDAFNQVNEMQRYFVKQTGKLAAGNAEFRHTAGSLVSEYIAKHEKFAIRGTNFFWDKNHSNVPEKIYQVYFSPYRERI